VKCVQLPTSMNTWSRTGAKRTRNETLPSQDTHQGVLLRNMEYKRHAAAARYHQAEHTHRHQTAVFRNGETCPEAGSKRALPSGPPPENGFPLNNVRVRGQTDPYTQHKRDSVPLWA